MDIIVKGKASKFFKPEQVNINLTFSNKNNKYENVLEEGLNNVQEFINNVLEKLGFSKEDLKTNSFNISEQNVYDAKTSKRTFDGYLFKQTANIKFDYDTKKMTKFMELVSLLKNPAYYVLNFNVKDQDACKNMVINDAYIVAKNKAEAIAKASGKKLVDCIKIDFQPFAEQVTSNSRINSFEGEKMMEKSMFRGATEIIENTFTPEDVLITEELYCLWLSK